MAETGSLTGTPLAGGCQSSETAAQIQVNELSFLVSTMGHFSALRIVRKELQRDETAEIGVFCFVHHTHSIATNFFNNAVARDRPADE